MARAPTTGRARRCAPSLTACASFAPLSCCEHPCRTSKPADEETKLHAMAFPASSKRQVLLGHGRQASLSTVMPTCNWCSLRLIRTAWHTGKPTACPRTARTRWAARPRRRRCCAASRRSREAPPGGGAAAAPGARGERRRAAEGRAPRTTRATSAAGVGRLHACLPSCIAGVPPVSLDLSVLFLVHMLKGLFSTGVLHRLEQGGGIPQRCAQSGRLNSCSLSQVALSGKCMCA